MPTYLGTTIPFFYGFTAFTPEVPKLYWNVKSQEQRIFELCKTQHKIICYIDAVAEQLNGLSTDIDDILTQFKEDVEKQLQEQNENIAQMLAAQDTKVETQLQQMRDYIDQKFEEWSAGVGIYDVTTGRYRPGIESMRRLFQALTFDHKGTTQLVSYWGTKTVAQMAAGSVYFTAYSTRQRITIDDQE